MKTFNKYYTLPITCNYGMFHDKNGNHILDIICKFPYDKPLTDFLLAKFNGKETDIKFTKKVEYKPTKIQTHKNEKLISIRGWGKFKYFPNGAEIQDAIGNEIAELINSSFVK